MSEIRCTAVVGDDEEQPNILFTPPCDCPRCAAVTSGPAPIRPARNWLRLPGRVARQRVEVHPLGEVGRSVLGDA